MAAESVGRSATKRASQVPRRASLNSANYTATALRLMISDVKTPIVYKLQTPKQRLAAIPTASTSPVPINRPNRFGLSHGPDQRTWSRY